MGREPPMLTPAVLSGVARQVTSRPLLTLTGWHWRQLHGGVSPTTGGVYRVWGTGRDENDEHAWSVILKLVRPTGGSADPSRHDYWRRELMVFQSATDFPPGPADSLAAPRCYSSDEDASGAWL